MSAQAIVLRYEEHGDIPEERQMAFLSFITVPLSYSGRQIEQKFVLVHTPLPVGASLDLHLAIKKIHFTFHAHQHGNAWNCKLVLHDVVPDTGRDKWRSEEVAGKRLFVKCIRWKPWDEHPALISKEEIFSTIMVLLNQHLRAIGWDGFNKWLRRMTPAGEIAHRVPTHIPIL